MSSPAQHEEEYIWLSVARMCEEAKLAADGMPTSAVVQLLQQALLLGCSSSLKQLCTCIPAIHRLSEAEVVEVLPSVSTADGWKLVARLYGPMSAVRSLSPESVHGMLVSAMQSGGEHTVKALWVALPEEALRGLDARTVSSLLNIAIQQHQPDALERFLWYLPIQDINAASCHGLLLEALSHRQEGALDELFSSGRRLRAATELKAREIGELLSLAVKNDMPGAVCSLCGLPGSYKIQPAVAEQLRAEARRVWGGICYDDDDDQDTGGSSEGRGSSSSSSSGSEVEGSSSSSSSSSGGEVEGSSSSSSSSGSEVKGSSSSSSSCGGEVEGSRHSSSGAVGGGMDDGHYVDERGRHQGVGELNIWAWERECELHRLAREHRRDSDCDSASREYFESEGYEEGSEEYEEEEEDYCENLASLWPQYEHYV